MSTPRKTVKAKTEARGMTRETVHKFPILSLCIVAGLGLMIGVGIGNSGRTGPAPAAAQDQSYTAPTTNGTPASEPSEEQPTEQHELKDSLVVSDNSGTVNIGGTHFHEAPMPDRTPATVIQPTITRTVVVEQPVKKPERKKHIWTRPGIPANSRLGRTMLTLQRFEDAGVRIYAEN